MAIRILLSMMALPLIVACSDMADVDQEEWDGVSGIDLHPSDTIVVMKSSDGIERGIFIPHDWLGDRYGPPRLDCRSSSIALLLKSLSKVSGNEVIEIQGEELFPEGTFKYSFSETTWEEKDYERIFIDVVKATEEAFQLQIAITRKAEGLKLVVTKK